MGRYHYSHPCFEAETNPREEALKNLGEMKKTLDKLELPWEGAMVAEIDTEEMDLTITFDDVCETTWKYVHGGAENAFHDKCEGCGINYLLTVADWLIESRVQGHINIIADLYPLKVKKGYTPSKVLSF